MKRKLSRYIHSLLLLAGLLLPGVFTGAFAQKPAISIELTLTDAGSGQKATYATSSVIYSLSRRFQDSLPPASRLGEMLVQTTVVPGDQPLAMQWVCDGSRLMHVNIDVKDKTTGKLIRQLAFKGVTLYQGAQSLTAYGGDEILSISFYATPQTTASGTPMQVRLPVR